MYRRRWSRSWCHFAVCFRALEKFNSGFRSPIPALPLSSRVCRNPPDCCLLGVDVQPGWDEMQGMGGLGRAPRPRWQEGPQVAARDVLQVLVGHLCRSSVPQFPCPYRRRSALALCGDEHPWSPLLRGVPAGWEKPGDARRWHHPLSWGCPAPGEPLFGVSCSLRTGKGWHSSWPGISAVGVGH